MPAFTWRESAEYAEFWERLNRGEYTQAEYKRLGKGGREVWIQQHLIGFAGLRKDDYRMYPFNRKADSIRC